MVGWLVGWLLLVLYGISKLRGNEMLIGQVGRVFPNGLGDLGSIAGRVIPTT